MKKSEINIRDPYVLVHENKYYLYGTRSATTWGKADGFDCYVSDDLEEWEGPFVIFHNDGNFWADQSYWAPECYYYQKNFYLVTTFGSENRKKGIQILKADSPIGPFLPISDGPVTPDDWSCIDATLYFDKEGEPQLIFSHSFEDVPEGDMCALKLSKDLTSAIGTPQLLFHAKQAPWAVPIPFAKQEFGMDGDVYLTDGPCMYRTKEDTLLMIWSSWGQKGYTVGVSYSDNGELDGNWTHIEKPLYDENGGHGMVFEMKDGRNFYALHFPNDQYKERPRFEELKETEGHIYI